MSVRKNWPRPTICSQNIARCSSTTFLLIKIFPQSYKALLITKPLLFWDGRSGPSLNLFCSAHRTECFAQPSPYIVHYKMTYRNCLFWIWHKFSQSRNHVRNYNFCHVLNQFHQFCQGIMRSLAWPPITWWNLALYIHTNIIINLPRVAF